MSYVICRQVNCFTHTAHNFKEIFLIDRITFWQKLMMHHTTVIEKKGEQNLHIWPRLWCFFRSWIFWPLPMERLGFNIYVITIHSCFVNIYNALELLWILVVSFNSSLTILMRRFSWSKYNNFRTHFAAPCFVSKISEKKCMIWTNRYADILGNFFYYDSMIIQCSFCHCFDVFIDCWHANWSRWISSLTSSRSSK